MSGVGCTGRLQGGIQRRLAHLEPRCSLADVQPVGDVILCPLQLVGGNDRLASTFSPASGGSGQPGLGALADQVALELAQCAEHMEDEPPARRRGVDGLSQRTESNATRFQCGYRIDAK
jgi:hypothetical protein